MFQPGLPGSLCLAKMPSREQSFSASVQWSLPQPHTCYSCRREEERAGWELPGAAGPELTSEDQLHSARQRRTRGEGVPQASHRKGDRLPFFQQSQEEVAGTHLDLSIPKTSQELPVAHSFQKHLLRT